MSLTLFASNRKNAALLALAVFALMVLFAGAPHRASAAAITLTTATTTSNNASTTLAKSGNTVSYGVQLSGTPWEAPKINIFGMGTTTMTGTGAFWAYSTTTSSAWTTGAVSFYFSYGGTTVSDATSTKSQADLAGSNVVFDKTAPTVTSVTSNATAAGVLKVGDTIVFTLTPGATEYGGSVAGSYNGRALTWASANAGVTFLATSTVTEGDTDQATALQISGVILSDAAGNAASAAASSNVAKTIDANSPSTPAASVVAGTYIGTQSTTLTSTGSNSILYTLDGTTPTCSVGTLYAAAFNITSTRTLQAVGCDTAGNSSAAASVAYVIGSDKSRSGGGGHVTRSPAAATASEVSVTYAPGAPSSAAVFIRDLGVGSVGDDVKALQAFLNTHGFAVAVSGIGSPGKETATFGGLTRAAVARFQAAKGITPAAGRFGPKTRAAVSAMQ